jgi:hypothetical protein
MRPSLRFAQVVVALATAALLGACSSGSDAHAVALPLRARTPTPRPIPSPSRPPQINSDGCKGLVTAEKVSAASGLAVRPNAGNAAAAVTQYEQGLQALGLTATAKLCDFGNPAGDDVTLVQLQFPDAAQATKLYQTGTSTGHTLTPVGGLGDAAAGDGSSILLVRKAKTVVVVYLVAAAAPTGNHAGPLRSLAMLAL